MTATWHATALRRACLAVSVLEDIDLTPAAEGVVVDGPRPAFLPWQVIADEVGDVDPETPAAHRRLSTLLGLHRMVAHTPQAGGVLTKTVRLLALPADHVFTPGSGWARETVLGGALLAGVGLQDVLGEGTVPLPSSVAEAARLPVAELWGAAREHGDAMARLAVQRLERDPGSTEDQACVTARQSVARPIGGVDVLSLLATPGMRRYLAASDRTGMRAVAVPMRSRGWFDLARIDPAFVQAAWTATEPEDRGMPRPMLVTGDEVVLAPAIGNPAAVLADPAAKVRRSTRSVRFHLQELAPNGGDLFWR